MTVRELLNAAQQLSLSEQIDLIGQLMQLIVQKLQASSEEKTPMITSEDPLIGLFSGSPELSTQSEDILLQELNSTSGLTWKK